MADLKRIFEDLDRLDPPVTWSDVKSRRPGPPLPEPERPRRILIVGLALGIAAAGVSLAIRAFVLAPAQRLSSPSAANGKIAFVRGPRSDHARLWTVNPDGTGLMSLTSLPGYSVDPSWSPDGKRVVFAYTPRVGSPMSLYAVNEDGTHLMRLTVCDEPACSQDYEPAWSPDGTRIALVRNQDIFVMNANGSDVRRLTHSATPLGDGQPAWSPDGNRIAFTVARVQPHNIPAIYVMNADGTAITRLTDCLPECIDSQPAWSPDGTKIAFYRNDNVYMMNSDGSHTEQLTGCSGIPGCVSAGGPVWSPDSREIAFWVERHDSNRQLYVMKADGGDVRPLLPKTSDDCCLAWQPLPSGTAPSPTSTSSPSAEVTSCVVGKTSGDFDGDGRPDEATLLRVQLAGQSCSQAPSASRFRLKVRFGSGGGFERDFPYCGQDLGCGTTAFTATDLGDGRSELAVDVGPGAAIDLFEFFRVDTSGFRPLRIAPERAAQAQLASGPAVLGGGFDSMTQNPLSCELRPDGTRMLVITRADQPRFPGPWRVERVELELRGDTLHVVAISSWTAQTFKIGPARFQNACS